MKISSIRFDFYFCKIDHIELDIFDALHNVTTELRNQQF